MLRLIGFVISAAGVLIGILDWQKGGSTFASFHFRDIGTIWAGLNKDSLLLLQPAVERHISVDLWQKVIQPFLLFPAAPVVLLIGIVVFMLGLRSYRRYRR
jgi:hypothetical protein